MCIRFTPQFTIGNMALDTCWLRRHCPDLRRGGEAATSEYTGLECCRARASRVAALSNPVLGNHEGCVART